MTLSWRGRSRPEKRISAPLLKGWWHVCSCDLLLCKEKARKNQMNPAFCYQKGYTTGDRPFVRAPNKEYLDCPCGRTGEGFRELPEAPHMPGTPVPGKYILRKRKMLFSAACIAPARS